MVTTRQGTGGALGLCRQIRGKLDLLLDSSRQLSRALVHRQVERCWDILVLQEQQAGDLNQLLDLWQSLFGDQAPDLQPEGLPEERQQVQTGLRQLQQLSRENAALSRSFSSVIRQSLDGLGKTKPSRSNLYNRYGRHSGNRQSLLINSVG